MTIRLPCLLLLIAAGSMLAPASASNPEPPFFEVGKASYYASRLHGRATASGERYDQTALTAAHPHLPFGTQACVTNLHNGRQVTVRINDRGPFTGNRIIDLSRQAAVQIDMLRAGIARVEVRLCPVESQD
ncbi:MAG: septal ring lytic transglycosylase RlpA family lipoprotein [Gammaproteobacteria bacterium HGW-Gammaproteobacteria-11]|nr:MAG: septal ring lytic transglycosylase RlpA family lipoprotein [Gammaproteobacteria bacterium HGW-Gammaproteobacteria-11]